MFSVIREFYLYSLHLLRISSVPDTILGSSDSTLKDKSSDIMKHIVYR